MENSLVFQWLGFCAFIAEGPSSIPSQETKIPQVLRYGTKKNVIIDGLSFSSSGR